MKKKIISILCAAAMLAAFVPMTGVSATAADGYYLLSGNSFDNTDRANYTAWDETVDLTSAGNQVSYTWLDEANAVGANDSEHKKLIDGKLSRTDGTNVVNSAAKYDVPTAVFDLGGNFAVDRVDILQNNSHSGNILRSVKVLVSTDNENFTEAGYQETDLTDKFIDGTTFCMTSVKFEAQNARYVKIELTRGANKFIVCEAAIFGYKRDLSELKNAIDKAGGFSERWYTAESVSALKSAVAEGEKLTEGSGQSDINAAVSKIEAAIKALVPINKRLVLTGNTWKSNDKSEISGLTGIDVENASISASYTLENNYPADNVKKLTNGGLTGTDTGNYALASAYDRNVADTISAIFDLGQIAAVDRVDAFTISTSKGGKRTDNISVSYSLNGSDWSLIQNKKAKGYDSVNDATMHTEFVFAPVTAKFIKVTFVKAAGITQQYPSEVVIFGMSDDITDSYTKLYDVIDKYSDTSKLEKFTTADSYGEFALKLAEAKTLYENQSGDAASIEKVISELNAAAASLVYKVSGYGVLSNNLVTTTEENLAHEPNPINTEGDFDYYDGMKNVPIGMTYSITADDNAVENDTGKVLFGGHILESDGKYCLWDDSVNNFTHTKSKSYVITVDAGEEVYFTGADLFELYRKGENLQTRKIGSVKAEVGTPDLDGNVTYKTVSFVSNSFNEDKTGINKIASDFAAAKGRYLRITTTREGMYQILAELVVKGFRDPEVLRYPYSCTAENYFEDADYKELSGLVGADYISTVYTITKNDDSEETGYDIYAAIYNADDVLVAVEKAVVNDEGKLMTQFTGLGGLKQGSRMVSYIWNGMTPVASQLTVE